MVPEKDFIRAIDADASFTKMPSVLTGIMQKGEIQSIQEHPIAGTSAKDFTGTVLSFVAWPIQDGFALAGRADFGAKVGEHILHEIRDFQVNLKDNDAAILSCQNPDTGKPMWLAVRLTETDAEGRPLRQDGQPLPP